MAQKFEIVFDAKMQLDSLKRNVTEMQSILSKGLTDLGSPQKTAQGLEKDFKKLVTSVEDFSLKVKNGFNSMADAKKAETALRNLTNLYENIKDTFEQLKIDPTALVPTESLKKIRELQGAYDAVVKSIQNFDATKALEAKNEEVERQKRKVEELDRKYRTAKSSFDALSNAKLLHEQALTQAKQEVSEYSAKLDEAKKKKEALLGQKTSRQAEFSAYDEDFAKKQQEIVELEIQRDKIAEKTNPRVQQYQAEIEQINEKIAALQKENEAEKDLVKNAKAAIELNSKLTKSQKASEKSKISAESTIRKTERNKEIGSLLEQRGVLEQKQASLAPYLKKEREQLAQLEVQLAQKREALNALKEKAQSRGYTTDAKERENLLQQEIQEAEKVEKQLRASLSKAESEEKRQKEALSKNEVRFAKVTDPESLRKDVERERQILDELKQSLSSITPEAATEEGIRKLVELFRQLGVEDEKLANIHSLDDFQKIITSLNDEELAKIAPLLDEMGINFEKCGGHIESCSSALERNIKDTIAADAKMREVEGLKSRITHFLGLSNAINLARRALRSAFETVKELDKTMTATAVVTDFTVGDMWAQLPEYTKRANELGVATNDAYAAATLYYQQG